MICLCLCVCVWKEVNSTDIAQAMPENLNAPFKMTGGVKGKMVEDDFLKC